MTRYVIELSGDADSDPSALDMIVAVAKEFYAADIRGHCMKMLPGFDKPTRVEHFGLGITVERLPNTEEATQP